MHEKSSQMTGCSPGAMLPLFYGAGKNLHRYGFDTDITFHQQEVKARRNLFGSVDHSNAEIYSGQGLDPAQQAATRKMLEQLAIHMKKCPWPGGSNTENRQIPAGYTYLAQLAAHDLVDNLGPLPRLNDLQGYFARDYRTDRLVLDTIYGGGPTATPLPFELANRSRGQRSRLRLGYVPPSEPQLGRPRPLPMMDQPPGDIGRAACPFLSDDRGKPIIGVPDALLADPRNDDHVIISQLTALFHQLHNIVDRKLHAGGSPGPFDDFVTYRRFLDARKIVALAFRSVIINDLLRRLLEPSVYNYYKADATEYPADFLDATDDDRVPVEFSHAVYRFGHVMAQFSYVLNDERKNGDDELAISTIGQILDRSSARDAEQLPTASTWLVDWSRFFDLGDRTPLNFSRPIRPFVGKGELTDNSYFSNEDGADGGIFYRDLIRGADAGVRTVDSVIKHLRREDRERSRLLYDRGYRQKEICDWLTQCSKTGHNFCPADRFSLTEDPPLLFFVLFEAAHTQNGERLGILGSVVVAEVFFAAYKKTFATIEGDRSFNMKLHNVFPGGAPSNMPAMIRFIKGEGGLADIQCPG
jgi:hypothetical protein